MVFLKKSSSYSLSLQGTFGFFRPPGSPTRTLMFQTWVSFNDSGQGLLERIKPVREQFDTKSMDLDDIVQRDIDDARVTSQLIPYLLNREGVQQPFRMFPNIIVNLVPVDKSKNLLDHHDKVSDIALTQNSPEASSISLTHDSRCIFSGSLGSGDFCARWPVDLNPNDNDQILHEYRHAGELEVNTSSTELIVVDGQHRAMSLIALYRNITKSWDNAGRGNKYKQFYEFIWTDLDPGALAEISLPVTICLYPDLCEGNDVVNDITFTKALRRNFTTLNSPAVPITRERKILLSETDLISTCMRSLSKAMLKFADKNKNDCHYAIYNLEIDKKKDLVAISNRVCSFSISSLHKICELMLLSGIDEYKTSLVDNGNYGRRALLEDSAFSSRLLLGDLFAPEDKPKSRFNFTMSQAKDIDKQFFVSYAGFAAKILLGFLPIEFHHSSCEEVRIELAGDQSNRIQSILFDGQGQQEIIKEFQKMVSDPSQVFPDPMPGARFKECKNSLDRDADSVIRQHENISIKRASKLFARASFSQSYLRNVGTETLVELVNFLWEKKFKSIAFQSALVMTPKILIESFDSSESQRLGELFQGQDVMLAKGLRVCDFVDDYLQAINSFFAPSKKSKLRDLLQLFNGRWADGFDLENLSSWKVNYDAPGPRFGSVVTKSMDPKHWCAYRFILLEVYRVNSLLLGRIDAESSLDSGIHSLSIAVDIQIEALRRSLIRKVYWEAYRQYSDSSNNLDPDQIQSASIDDAVRRINVILDACGVRGSRKLNGAFAIDVMADKVARSDDDPDSYADDDDGIGED